MAFYKTSTVILLHLIVTCTLTSSFSVPNYPRLLHSNLIGGRQSIEDVWTSGWMLIEDVNDPTIQGLAKFALSEHNKLHNTRLQFGRVIEGEDQQVAGLNYRLILAASSDGKPGIYEAMVYVRPWENIRKLKSFRSV